MIEESSDQSCGSVVGQSCRDRRFSPIRVVAGTAAGVVILVIVMLAVLTRPHRTLPSVLACRANLRQLAMSMLFYDASGYVPVFPTPEQWCDLLLVNVDGLSEELFRCPGGRDGRCHYAMNPNAGFHSGPDMVLLFETADGWNQAGGPELLTTDWHGGCNVAFVDGSVRFIKPDELGKLKWRDDSVPDTNRAGGLRGTP